MMPKCYQVVGVPGSGKSTWIKSQKWKDGCALVGTDMWVELEANRRGMTYSEVFDDYMPQAVRLMIDDIDLCREMGTDIIWDQTSLTVASRKKKFKLLPDYEHIAVVFPTPDWNELVERLASRPGRNIPKGVLKDMIKSFQMPTSEEGFKQIWFC